jgi:hypothetical protein
MCLCVCLCVSVCESVFCARVAWYAKSISRIFFVFVGSLCYTYRFNPSFRPCHALKIHPSNSGEKVRSTGLQQTQTFQQSSNGRVSEVASGGKTPSVESCLPCLTRLIFIACWQSTPYAARKPSAIASSVRSTLRTLILIS